ncbi:MAG: response regulator [Acidobacteria bacterium]|nr:response regulator [Acidobacteriota bacterium]
MKILVADDNRSIPKKVAEALKEQGFEVVGVGHGEAAVKKLPEFMPDLVLADVFMPVRNGYEVCEYVKNDKRFAHIPVVLLVGAFDPIDQHEVKRVRADGLLKKPFDPPADLLEMVRTMLEKSVQARPVEEKKESKVDETVELSHKEMKDLVSKGGAAPAEAQPEVEEFATRPARVEFGEGSEALSFGELLETPAGPEEPKVVEEAPRPEASGFRASSVPDIEFAGKQGQEEEEEVSEEPAPPVAPQAPSWGAMDSAAEETEVAAASAQAAAPPETPQWGGIEVPAKEPSPDEPPIKVEFEPSEPMELVIDEIPAPATSIVDAGPLPELASSPDDFMSAASSPAAPAEVPKMEAAPFSIPDMEELAAPPVAEEPILPPAPEPPPVAAVEPPRKPAQIIPPPVEFPRIARPLDMDSSGAAAAVPGFTGNTDAFGRPAHMNPAQMDAIVEKVIARLQKGVLDQITRDILRPIVEALVAREVENKK